jgi:carbamoyltransferase
MKLPSANPVYVLGYNQSHDASAALIRDGHIAYAIAQERISRKKHEATNVAAAIKYVLDAENITPKDLSLIVACNLGRPLGGWPQAERDFHVELASSVGSVVVHSSHHELHAYSALYTSPFMDAAIVVADGTGSRLAEMRDTNLDDTMIDNEPSFDRLMYLDYQEGESLFVSVHGKELRSVLRRFTTRVPYDFASEDISLGRLYSYASKHIFETNFDAGKTMALASYGDASQLPSFLCIDGESIRVDRKLLSIFGMKPMKNQPTVWVNLAARVQEDVQHAMLRRAQHLRRATDVSNLCIAGGVGLNCTANQLIRIGAGFDRVYCMPASTDDGIAIGAALFGYHNLLGRERLAPSAFNAYLGRNYRETEVTDAVALAANRLGGHLRVSRLSFEDESLYRSVSQILLEDKVIGWFQGRSEFGPRALGNRSILASPATASIRDRINGDIKGRESFRPLAPIVLQSECSRYFEVDIGFASPHMMFNVPVRAAMRAQIPAVVHTDGTARVQTVTNEDNEMLAALLEHMTLRQAPPVLLNTSLNGPGDPIVETPAEAVDLFTGSTLDALVLKNYLLLKV